jgi:hypothetical protein
MSQLSFAGVPKLMAFIVDGGETVGNGSSAALAVDNAPFVCLKISKNANPLSMTRIKLVALQYFLCQDFGQGLNGLNGLSPFLVFSISIFEEIITSKPLENL